MPDSTDPSRYETVINELRDKMPRSTLDRSKEIVATFDFELNSGDIDQLITFAVKEGYRLVTPDPRRQDTWKLKVVLEPRNIRR